MNEGRAQMRVDGLLIIDKPQGMTSLDVVREIKTRFFIRKAGHVGTLDPFATGVLPIVLNEGTKLVPFLREDPKEYEGAMKIGEETRTDDLTGEVVKRTPWNGLSSETIETVFKSFLGKSQQVPPMFSAVKLRGEPLYRIARKGIEVERKEREITIYNLQIERIDLPTISFKVSCSRGTYIRALTRDIGRRLGCGAHLLSLRRTRNGPFSVEQALSIESLRRLRGEQDVIASLIPLREMLGELPEMIGDDRLIQKVRNGKGMLVRDLSPHLLPPFQKGQWLKMSSPKGGLVAILQPALSIGEMDQADPERVALRPVRVFHPFSQKRESRRGIHPI